MRLAYLACALTLPGSAERRIDAFEHDQMMACLGKTFGRHGSDILAIGWDDEAIDWRDFDAVLIGSTWDYQDRLDEFLATLDRIASVIPLFNPPDLIRWNCRKTYLRDLESRGAPVIPTLWLDPPSEADVAAAFDQLGTGDIVLKRQIGANAEGQHRLRRGDPCPLMPHPMMAQPFFPAIQHEGEISFVFIDGELSHALRKQAASGDYRIQSSYGGNESSFAPLKGDLDSARQALAAVDGDPLYARVDMLRGEDGKLRLMELEMIEPFLYPLQGDDLGEHMHAALGRRLG
ncbi:MAG: hypothetical protein HKN78_04055 [Sphingomonadaceae bacterium]|nr:hypothetical protein [Sphingomonadaceae bacterium]